MPKKKGNQQPQQRAILGRPTTNVKMGIVGLPNVGKSSLFNCLSARQVPAENYPFCTIEPSKAQVAVEDKRFDKLVEHYHPRSVVPAVLTVWDIAGLVRGAHEGQGLGNEFLSNIGSVDGIFHVVRAFSDRHIEHVEGDVNPVRDLEIISAELRQKDIAILAMKLEAMEKMAKRSKEKRVRDELDVVVRLNEWVNSGKDVAMGAWSNVDIEFINTYNLFTAKPVVFLVNVSKKNWLAGKNKWMPAITDWVQENYPGSTIIPFSAAFENDLVGMTPEERTAFLEEKHAKSAIQKIVKTGYKALSLIHFFTCGEDEVRAWTIRHGTRAPKAAGAIHTDFERGFICAETFAYKDFKKHGSETAVRAAGKYHQNGRGYEVQDGDILLFKFNN